MTIEEIRKGAPSVADYYIKIGDRITYIRYDDNSSPFYFDAGHWYVYKGTFSSKGEQPLF